MSKAQIRKQLRRDGIARVIATYAPEPQIAEVSGLPASVQRSDSGCLLLPNLGMIYGQLDESQWERLQEEVTIKEVRAVPPLQPITGLGSLADVEGTSEVSWGMERLGAPRLWDMGLTGEGVLVAHLDTGVDGSHPSLTDAVEHFAEFDATGNLIPGAPILDSGMHGTHTAGIIAGRPSGGRRIGVAPGCRLVCGAVLEADDRVARLLAGVNWALNFPIKVLNLSLGFPGYFPQYIPLLRTIRGKGVLPVFSAGNEGAGTSYSPANYPQALSVGAIDESGVVDDSSSSDSIAGRRDARIPDLVMPGMGIISASAGGGFRSDSGTSMAAPHAAGLAALLWQAYPAARMTEVERAIYGSCERSAAMPLDRAGRGFPDAVKAVDLLRMLVAKRRGKTRTA